MKRAHAVTAGLFAIVVAALAFVWMPSCQRRDEGESAAVVDTELMAFLSEARALHHIANSKEESGDLPGAIDAMERLVAARRPHADRKTPEIEEVLADAHARLAELRLKVGDVDKAADDVRDGLAHAPEPTYFRGHLVEVQGLVEEARAAQLADAGKTAEAAKAREQAIKLLEEVVKIQDQVIQRSLGDTREGGSP
ncbi:MAG: hypothetical protein KF819_20320 [Labilithrix sp.]|nr:hypothetical protein [Labilithrix sp.]